MRISDINRKQTNNRQKESIKIKDKQRIFSASDKGKISKHYNTEWIHGKYLFFFSPISLI